jgi:Mg-chelatase subunit ChlD
MQDYSLQIKIYMITYNLEQAEVILEDQAQVQQAQQMFRQPQPLLMLIGENKDT